MYTTLVTEFTILLNLTYSHHAWCSFEAAAEIYNELIRESGSLDALHTAKYLKMCPIRMGKLLY